MGGKDIVNCLSGIIGRSYCLITTIDKRINTQSLLIGAGRVEGRHRSGTVII